MTALAGGGFGVTAYTTGGNPEVRIYTAAGVPTSGWVLVTSNDNGATLTSTVAAPGGGFYVSWWDNHLESNAMAPPPAKFDCWRLLQAAHARALHSP
ncbi:MAG: hypothetical protein CR217_18875 [Beijerinckiaceae bacterium]|nr:MAG: hypothetical protein CR217_18875 [Beijerinckiaceae bacterium]